MDKCPSFECKIDLIKCLNKKVSKGYLGASLSIVIAACSVVAYLSYDAYSDGKNVRVAIIEKNREKIAEHDTSQKLIGQSLDSIKENLKDFKFEQKEVNGKILRSLEELKVSRSFKN